MNEMPDSEQKCSACGKDISEYRQLPHTLKLGSMLNSRYLVGGVIGEGGFGITYIGLDTLLQFRVAIKEFFPNGMVNRNNTVSDEVMSISTETAKELFSKSRENFLREARTLAKFTNESGIVAVRDFFEENRTVYIVMEYLDGITLKNYLNQVGTISAYNTVCLLMPVFHSLKKIHEKNLIHRDISPDNIMLVDEEVKLLDFGAAREFADERSLSVMLKHGYAPMEQYRRHGTQGAWTDVYAICATMYKCITGKIPPDAPDRVFEDDLKMPSELGISIEPAFEEVLRHGLAVRPEDRIQSIDELLEELDAVPGIDIGVSSQPPKSSSVEPNVGMSSGGISGGSDGARLSEYVPHLVDEPISQKPAQPKPAAPAQHPSQPKPVAPAPQPSQPKPVAPAPKPAQSKPAAPAPKPAQPKPVAPAPKPAQPKPAAPAPQPTQPKPAAPAQQPLQPKPVAPAPQPSQPKPVAPAPQKKKSSKGALIGIVAALLVLLVGGGVAAAVIFGMSRNGNNNTSSAPENSSQQSSQLTSSTESSAQTSEQQSTESSAESPAEQSSAAESSAPESSQTSASESSEPQSSTSIFDTVKIPDASELFYFKDGLLMADLSMMGENMETVKSKIGRGTLFTSKSHPLFGDEYEILLVPFDSPKNNEDNIESVDFYFKDDKLVIIQWETESEFDESFVSKATKEYGQPVYIDTEDYQWMVGQSGFTFEEYMIKYENNQRNYAQRYISPDAAYG